GWTIIGFCALLINTGFFYRNYQLSADPMGPKAIRCWGLTYDMTTKLILSNVVKTTLYQMGNALPVWNKFVVNSVEKFHKALGIDIVDDRSTISRTPFAVPVSVHEDSVTNFLQTTLILLSFPLALSFGFKKRRKDIIFYLVTIATAFVIVCAAIR